MPEYLAPGVYVEEVSFRSKSIEGVATTTTGFIGPTRFGPTDVPPDVVTNLAEFERTYGGGEQLDWDGKRVHNYMWHAARAFYENGGRRLYVQRTFDRLTTVPANLAADGHAVGWPGRAPTDAVAAAPTSFVVRARFPGAAGNFIARFAPRTGENVFVAAQAGQPARVNSVQDGDIVSVKVVNPTYVGEIAVTASGGIDAITTAGELVVTSANNADTRAVTLYGIVGGSPVAVEVTLVAGTATTSGSSFAQLHGVDFAAGPDAITVKVAGAGGQTLVSAAAAPVAVKTLTATLSGASLTLRAGAASTAGVLVAGTDESGADQVERIALNGTTPVTSALGWGSVTAIAAGRVATGVEVFAGKFVSSAAGTVTVSASAATTVNVTVEGRSGVTARSNVIALNNATAGVSADTFTAVDRVVVQAPVASTLTVSRGDVVMYRFGPTASAPAQLRKAVRFYDTGLGRDTWRFEELGNATSFVTLEALLAPTEVRPVVVTVDVRAKDGAMLGTWGGLGLATIDDFFSEVPATLGLQRSLPIVVKMTGALPALFATAAAADPTTREANVEIELFGGNDGLAPSATASASGFDASYEGKADPTSTIKTGLKAFEDIEDISIVAAPGSTWVDPLVTGGPLASAMQRSNTVVMLLVAHAERMRYRIAVVDSVNNHSIADVRAFRARFDSKYAALYYPWVRVLDPVTRKEITLPPSGFMTGIYARNDILRAVYKAPANEIVTLALGFEQMLSHAQQEVLNPEGINCLRFFEGRGMRVWGARTISSDPDWKYVNVRRYFNYLEHSIDRGTQWAVFEPNGPLLWNNVRRTIEDFLVNEFQTGALLGDKPEKSFFARCDRSTMNQNDLDNGRLICLIGVAPVKPAEFVIFRIGQWTADTKN